MLPPAIWLGIFLLFGALLKAGGPVLEILWRQLAPVSYTAHMLDDYDLANMAGKNPAYLPALQARADAGDKSAMFQYGDIYDPTDFRCETSVPKNAAVAVFWYEKAVVLDDQGAERNLGILYQDGVGVPRDNAKAAALFEMAVTHHNDEIADDLLADMLRAGQGEPQDVLRAVRLEQASAAQDDVWAMLKLGTIYEEGLGVAPNEALARRYLDDAVANGDSETSGRAKALLGLYGLR